MHKKWSVFASSLNQFQFGNIAKSYGFKKTVEVSTETDENGKTTKKTTIYYKVTDDCSKVAFWESVLEQRMPEELQASKLSATTACQRSSKAYRRSPDERLCMVMLEIHPNQCVEKGSVDNGVSKRGTARNICMHIYCMFCWAASIQYDN